QLKQQMLELRAKLDEIDTLSTCPTCKRPMDPRHKQRLRGELVSDGTRLRDEFRANEALCRDLDGAIKRDETLLAQAAAALRDREAVHGGVAQAESWVATAEEALRQGSALDAELSERKRTLADGRFAAEARREVARLDRQIATLGYDEKRHVEVRTRATEL